MTNHANNADDNNNTNDTSGRRTLKLRTPADAVIIAAHVLGFMPADSLVILAVSGRLPHSRVDFPHTGTDLLETLTTLAAAYNQHADPQARTIVLAWTNDTHQARQVLPAVGAMLADVAPAVLALQVHDGDQPAEAWTDHSDTLSEHPNLTGPWPTGTITTADRDRIAAETIGTPVATPAASREAFASRLEPDPEATEATQDLIETHSDGPGNFTAGTIATMISAPGDHRTRLPLTATKVAGIAVAVNDPSTRAALVMTVRRANAQRHLDFWTEVARRTPATHRAVALLLVALTCWLTGQGALGWIALDAYEAHRDPETGPDPLAQVIETALSRAKHPEEWEKALGDE